MHALTKARTDWLCRKVRRVRLRAISKTGSEHGADAMFYMATGLEQVLLNVVADLGDRNKLHLLQAAFDDEITDADLDAYRAEQSALQQRLKDDDARMRALAEQVAA